MIGSREAGLGHVTGRSVGISCKVLVRRKSVMLYAKITNTLRLRMLKLHYIKKNSKENSALFSSIFIVPHTLIQ